MKTILILLLTSWTAFAQTTLEIQSAVNLPDATGGAAGEGFTCTGICPHSSTGWWVMNYGVEDPADVTFSSNIVHLSEDFTTNLGEIDLSLYGSASMQGVALDTTDNTLWVCIGANVRHYSEAGAHLSNTISPTGGANGVAYDAANDILYCMTAAGAFATYSPNTLALINTLTSCPAASPDHLTMRGTKVWCSAGANGVNGTIWEYDPVGNTWTQLYTLSSADATEGCIVSGSSLYICQDGYYHSAQAAVDKNRMLTFALPAAGGSITVTGTLNITGP